MELEKFFDKVKKHQGNAQLYVSERPHLSVGMHMATGTSSAILAKTESMNFAMEVYVLKTLDLLVRRALLLILL